MRRSWWLVVLTALAVFTAPPVVGAVSRASTLDGSCDFAVTVTFDPPLTNAPQDVDQTAKGTGTCSGTFVDRRGREHQLSDSPVTYYSFSEATGASCLSGVNSGTGTLGFAYGKLRFAFDEKRAGPFPTLSYTGAQGGSALGNAEPAAGADPVAAVQACGGDGLRAFDVEGRLGTTPT